MSGGAARGPDEDPHAGAPHPNPPSSESPTPATGGREDTEQAKDGRGRDAAAGPDAERGEDEADTLPLPVGRREGVRRAVVVAGGVTLSALVLAAGVYALVRPYLNPDDPGHTGAVTVRITPGAGAADVGELLAASGVVTSARSFVEAAERREPDEELKPGFYRLRTGMAAGEALDLLLAPASGAVRRVTLPEGMRLDETLRHLAEQSGVPLADLRAVDSRQVGLPDYAQGLEGFLFPATYAVQPGTTAGGLLTAMAQRFATVADRLHLEERAARLGLTPLQAVTVASIVQAEPAKDADYPKIARVIYNRLRRDMPLRIDSTILYALGKRTPRLSRSDTKVGSPYNTYTRKGLPPGPISNPGVTALKAALHPAKGDWYWFVTTDPAHRITKFTDKESEFVRYREELNAYLGTN
ncbi:MULTISPECIES: endolytic transglycosylase MltG [unclassified Nonomuraea]|uniref:endolytic transglycosylase MltG n=1 Tax=unclassified Nonomuraea TaxID=2593643 RepID=UPI0033FFEBC4